MELFKLLLHLEHDVIQGSTRREIGKVTNDTRKIEAKDVFVCIKGCRRDGHDLVNEAIEKGVAALVIERNIYVSIPPDITIIQVPDTRYALSILTAAYYGYPAEKLRMIGITGTKGKSTVACMIHQILNYTGRKAGLIGTIRVDTGKQIYKNQNTTPDSEVLQYYLNEMVEAGCEFAVMEVSSQGLKLDRVAGIAFEIGVFTNLEEDHIGPNEHADFEEYLICKKKLFERCRIGIGNVDDPYYSRMFANTAYRKITYGIEGMEADYLAKAIETTSCNQVYGIRFICIENTRTQNKNIQQINLKIPGEFNVYNSLAVIAVLRYFDIPFQQIADGMEGVKIPGRLEEAGGLKDCKLYIDYAHNAMSLRTVLLTIRKYEPKRIVLVFGCGGNRARERRFSMGRVAGEYADFVIITTDNPRYESPDSIIKDIEKGLKKTKGNYKIISDRKEAVRYAVEHRQPGDVILIAGKGHETYQEIKGVRYELDDRQLVKEACSGLGNE